MFDALRKRLSDLAEAPQRAREMAADRITATMPKGHAVATGDGIAVTTENRKPFVGERWRGIIEGAIRDATKGG